MEEQTGVERVTLPKLADNHDVHDMALTLCLSDRNRQRTVHDMAKFADGGCLDLGVPTTKDDWHWSVERITLVVKEEELREIVETVWSETPRAEGPSFGSYRGEEAKQR